MYLYVGNRHADEIVQLSLSLLKALKTMRENSSKFPRVQGRIGVHSGKSMNFKDSKDNMSRLLERYCILF